MLKSMLVGTVALALAGSGVALAQQGRPAQPSPPAAQVSPPQGSPQQSAPQQTAPQQQAAPAQQSPSAQQQSDALATAEGRIAELRARLSLTPDQEKNWPAFEQAYRDFARVRSERWADLRAQQRSDNPVENFQIWADFASRRVNGMKRLADAAVPFYQALDQNQQRRFMDQIYAWHPRLARLSNRIAAGGATAGAAMTMAGAARAAGMVIFMAATAWAAVTAAVGRVVATGLAPADAWARVRAGATATATAGIRTAGIRTAPAPAWVRAAGATAATGTGEASVVAVPAWARAWVSAGAGKIAAATSKAVAMDVVPDRAWDRAQAGATATMTTNGKAARAAAAGGGRGRWSGGADEERF